MYKFKKVVIVSVLALIAALIFSTIADASVRVKGYYRKDGTYVQPHYRSNPDGNPYNNWSYPGNTNPYTGETAPGNPDTYLENYYNNKSSAGSSVDWLNQGTGLYHVYQYDKYLQSFKNMQYATNYAQKWDHSKVLSGTTNIVIWHNYPYHVYQNDKYLNSFSSLFNALNYAGKWDHSSVVDGSNQKTIWKNY